MQPHRRGQLRPRRDRRPPPRQPTGLKGPSLFFSPAQLDSEKYPNLKYIGDLGVDLAPYDTMHLILQNVVPFLWKCFSGQVVIQGQVQPYRMSTAHAAAVGQEIAASTATVPASQARSLRNLHVRLRSYEAVDWMVFVLSTGEAVLSDRISETGFSLFMALCQACRFLFRPTALTEADILQVHILLKRFCTLFYSHVYRGSWERVPPRRSTIAATLDVVPNLRTCGPAWVYWQFPMERHIGTLPRLIKSKSHPYPSLAKAVSRKYKAELVTSFAEQHLKEEWCAATGVPSAPDGTRRSGSFSLAHDDGSTTVLLPPREAPRYLTGSELLHMRATLKLEPECNVPDAIFSKKYIRLQLPSGVLVGSRPSSSDDDKRRRRSNCVRIRSTAERRRPDGSEEEYELSTYGIVLHYALVFIAQKPTAFAYFECVKSTADRTGRFRIAERRREMDCFSGFGGARRYVDVAAIASVVGTLWRSGRHMVLFNRERFSDVP